jgi:hypothetical protein
MPPSFRCCARTAWRSASCFPAIPAVASQAVFHHIGATDPLHGEAELLVHLDDVGVRGKDLAIEFLEFERPECKLEQLAFDHASEPFALHVGAEVESP